MATGEKATIGRTPAQRKAVETEDRALLVSAAAGSGKTSVLAWRCAHLVCDAESPCNVNDLLVVTFTDLAASEMKSRIERELRKRAESNPSPRLQRQLKLVDHASISTLHGFCQRLLKQHFHRLKLDPDFEVLDEDEVRLIRQNVAEKLIDERFESQEERFLQFAKSYGGYDGSALVPMVIGAHNMLSSLVDPEKWMAAARAANWQVATEAMDASHFGRAYLDWLRGELSDLQRECRATQQTMSADFDKYAQYLGELGATLEEWNSLLNGKGYDALVAAVNGWTVPRLPTYRADVPGKTAAQSLVKQVSDRMKNGLAAKLLFSADEWRDTMQKVAPHADEFLELVSTFARRFTAAKRAQRGIDFSDQERLTLQLLREPDCDELAPSEVARSLHKRYRHVMVDEYQDINELQDAILYLVSTECLAERGEREASNLFCVGDVKQSIYRFRSADPQRFLLREKRYRGQSAHQPVDVVDLQSNFRSRKPLLDAVNAFFERLMTEASGDVDYDERHRLNAGLAYPPGDGSQFDGAPIEVLLVPKVFEPAADTEQANEGDNTQDELRQAEREALVIATRIGQMMHERRQIVEMSSAGPVYRPIRFQDIVILLRAPRYIADQYVSILRRQGIPAHTSHSAGLFDATEIMDMLALLRVLDNQRQDVALAAYLRSPLATLANADDQLARIRLRYKNEEEPVAFHEAAARYAAEADDPLAAHLRDLFDQLRRWRELASQRPLAELIWTIYDETHFIVYCSGLADGAQRVANLMELHARAQQFGSFRRQGLWRFLQFMHTLETKTDAKLPGVPGESAEVVRIMSVHTSKGLEFPVVFLSNLGRKHNQQDSTGQVLMDRDALLGLNVVDDDREAVYPSLGYEVVKQRINQQSKAEALRLLYVAMTRAREHLILVGVADESAVEKWQQKWAGHRGPVSASAVLAADSMLEWVGIGATVAGGSHFDLKVMTRDDVMPGRAGQPLDRHPADQSSLKQLKPLPADPPMTPAARRVIDGLTWRYGHEEASRRPATQSVSALSKPTGAPVASDAPGSRALAVDELPLPRVMQTDTAITGADRGTYTHTVLQHLDFTRPCIGDDLKQQIDALVDRRLLLESHAAEVQRDTIEWMMTSRVGQLLRQHAHELLREVTIYLSHGSAADPRDNVMVRGRVDLIIPTSAGHIVVDYKTDRVTGKGLHARADFYAEQVRLYNDAIHRITGQPPIDVWLVFLHAKQVIAQAK